MRLAPEDQLNVLVTLDFPRSFLDSLRAVDDRIVVDDHPVAKDADPATSVPADVLAHARHLRQTEQLAATYAALA